MPALTTRQQTIIGGVLLLVMLATRVHLFEHSLDASWAVFLLAGVYLQSWSAFACFMLAAVGIDYAAINVGGVSAFCLSPAYAALVPAYATLHMAGRWFARHYSDNRSALAFLVPAFLGGVVGCELISSGSFYLLSGRFGEIGLGEFLSRELTYLPQALAVTGLYVAIAALVHLALTSTAEKKLSA
jgi:hypothetical protein